MQQLVTGFIIAFMTGAAVAFIICKKKSATHAKKNTYPEQLEQLSRLTGTLAHEIKNPLSTIKINLKLVGEELADSTDVGTQQKKISARVLRKIDVIQKEADRLEQILNGFLRYLDRGPLQLESLDINELVSDMVDFYSPQAHSRSITIRLSLHTEPLVCKVDADMLKQAVLNLFINAQQAMDQGGELMIRTDTQNGNAVIQVSDTGSGIAADKLPHIFAPYYSSRPQGSGLGLPISRKIIESHNGTITVDSDLGKGTLFTIKLSLDSERNRTL